MHAAATRSDAEPSEPAGPAEAAPMGAGPSRSGANARARSVGRRSTRRRGARRCAASRSGGRSESHSATRRQPALGAARRRSVGVAAAANGVIGSKRLAAGALAGFALRTQSCRAGRVSLRGASAPPDLPHAATADAVGTGGAFAPASRRDGSRRPRTIFCKRLRLSDQLAMWEGCGGPLPREGLRRRQNRLSGARPRMRRPMRPRRPITGRSGAPTRREGRGFMPRRSRPRSGGAAGRGARTPPFPSPPARMRHRSRQPTI